MNVFVSTIPCTYMEMVKYTKYSSVTYLCCLGGYSAKYLSILRQTCTYSSQGFEKVPFCQFDCIENLLSL